MSEPTIYQRIAAHARREGIDFHTAARQLAARAARRRVRRRLSVPPEEAYRLNESQKLA